MNVETYSVSQLVPVTTQLQLKKLEDGLYLYKRETSSGKAKVAPGATMKAGKVISASSSDQGAVDEAGRQALLAGKNPTKLPLIALTAEELEGFRMRGWPAMEAVLYASEKERSFNPNHLWDVFEKDPSLTPGHLVRADVSSHMLFDRKGEALPVALQFDYIRSRIDETRYDLEKLAAHLLERMDVVVYSGKQSRARDELPVATSAKDAIFTIPHYNAEEGRTQSIQFRWAPNPDDYAKVWASCKGQYPSTQLYEQLFALDILETRQFKRKKAARPSY